MSANTNIEAPSNLPTHDLEAPEERIASREGMIDNNLLFLHTG